MAVTLEAVLELAKQLKPGEQQELAARLRDDQARPPVADSEFTPEAITARREALKAAGAFDHAKSLAGIGGPPRYDLSFEEIQATIREATTEWEKEIDEFYGPVQRPTE